MSNSNNPFLPYLVEENNNNNENKNQNNNETNNTLPHYVEEGSSIAATPPAYEDVVKPGYNYQSSYPPNNQSYPLPSYPLTVPVAENFNQTPVNSNDKTGAKLS